LAAAGYYAYSVTKNLGTGELTIRARLYAPGGDERLMAGGAERFSAPSEDV
jgi:hypothetical protein